MYFLIQLLFALLRPLITPIKPGPAAINDPALGVSGQAGALADVGDMTVILQALSTNGSPAFGNWSQTLIPNNVSARTITGNEIVGGIVKRFNPGTAFTDCTDTATNIVNAIPGATVNQSFPFIVANLGSTLTGTMTLGAGTGVTITGTATVATGFMRLFLGTVTGSTTVSLTSCFTFFGGSSGGL